MDDVGVPPLSVTETIWDGDKLSEIVDERVGVGEPVSSLVPVPRDKVSVSETVLDRLACDTDSEIVRVAERCCCVNDNETVADFAA